MVKNIVWFTLNYANKKSQPGKLRRSLDTRLKYNTQYSSILPVRREAASYISVLSIIPHP